MPPQSAGDLLITNARLIDCTGAPPIDTTSILVRRGLIEEIAPQLQANDVTILDADGATVMPGLIDAHVHLQGVPGSAFRRDGEEELRRARLHHLRAYLASGVTTVLEAAIAAPVLRDIQRHLASGGIGPRVMALAPAFYPSGGYLDNDYFTPFWGPMWRPTATAENVSTLFEEYAGIPNIIGVKAFIEPGFGPVSKWPIPSPELREIIRREAAARDLPVYVHSLAEKPHRLALEMNARALMHSGFAFRLPSESFVSHMQAGGAYLVTTLVGMYDCMLARKSYPQALEDPLIRLTVPDEQIDTARQPRAWGEAWKGLLGNALPNWLPGFMSRTAKAVYHPFIAEMILARALGFSGRAILALHEVGIPIVIGTDSGAMPTYPACFHGPSTAREMELLGRAGLPPMDVLCSATRIPAEMMGIGEETGTVEAGKEADLIVVPEDPLTDLTALQRVAWTIKSGVCRRPAEWMDDKNC